MDSNLTYVYIIATDARLPLVKIGMASNPESRLKSLQTSNGTKLSIIALFPCKSRRLARSLEQRLHYELGYHRLEGEWFSSGALIELYKKLKECGFVGMGAQIKQQLFKHKAESALKALRRDEEAILTVLSSTVGKQLVGAETKKPA